jgi:hypothetical protein
LLGPHTIPDKDIRRTKYSGPIGIRSDNGHRVINNRQRVNSTKRQEPSATKTSKVTPSAKNSRPNPKAKLFSSDEESSKGTINSTFKESEVEKEDEVVD